MSFEVHKEPLYRRYYATPVSAACGYTILYGFLSIFLPLIIAYNSSYFWLKTNITYEQPMVAYRYETIVQLNGITSNPHTGTSEALSLYYSTSPTINTLYEDYIRYPLVQSSEVDVNQDGLIDRLELNIQMPLQSYEEIHSINCFVYHNVQFNGKTKILIDTGSYFSYSHALPMGSLTVEGDLEFKQTWPLPAKGGYAVPYETDPLLPTALEYAASTVSSSDVSLKAIMKRYTSRNFTTHFNPSYTYAEVAPTTVNSLDASSAVSNEKQFNTSMVIRIPEQSIRYTPPVSEVLKFAWIQYISFFIITTFLLHRLTSFIFRNQLLRTYGVVDVMSNKND